MMNRRISAAFVVSGFAGLVFEVALQRSLSRVFGVSVWASATVLAAYMAGLALGAFLIGRFAARVTKPARLYAALEIGIGVYAAIAPWLVNLGIDGIAHLARGQSSESGALVVLRLVLAFALTLLPTALMGGTLPVLLRALPSHYAVVGRLYSLNLIGAVVGAALAPYLLLPWLGLGWTLKLGALANLIAAACALSALGTTAVARDETTAATVPVGRTLAALAAISGLTVLALEVVWTHLLSVVVGTTAYAFGLMLAVFLTGLTLGSAWSARRAEQMSIATLAWCQVLAAAALAVTLPLWESLPSWFPLVGRVVTSFAGREAVRAMVALELVLVPAALLGAVFPGVLSLAGRQGAGPAGVGRLIALNTIGAVVASLSVGFLLVPALGSQRTVCLIISIIGLTGVWLLRDRRRWLGLAAALGVWLWPGWNVARLASGNSVYFTDTGFSGSTVKFAAESVGSGFTTVVQRPNSSRIVLLTNGKFQGSDGDEVRAQLAITQLPMLPNHGFERALLIGIGTGSSLSALAAQPFQTLEAAELAPDIVEAARRFFGEANHHVLEPGRVQLSYADGRNHLLLSNRPYDVISLEITNVWFAGASDLYTREFMSLVRSRLKPDGVLQQWVQLHHLTRHDLAVMLASIHAELPHVQLYFSGGQGIVLASAAPIVFDYQRLTGLSKSLRDTPATEGLPGGDVLTLLGALVLDERGIEALIAEEHAMPSTDDNLYLEYATPPGNVHPELTAQSLLLSLEPLAARIPTVAGAEEGLAHAHVLAAHAAGRGAIDRAKKQLEGVEPDERVQPLSTWLQTAIEE